MRLQGVPARVFAPHGSARYPSGNGGITGRVGQGHVPRRNGLRRLASRARSRASWYLARSSPRRLKCSVRRRLARRQRLRVQRYRQYPWVRGIHRSVFISVPVGGDRAALQSLVPSAGRSKLARGSMLRRGSEDIRTARDEKRRAGPDFWRASALPEVSARGGKREILLGGRRRFTRRRERSVKGSAPWPGANDRQRPTPKRTPREVRYPAPAVSSEGTFPSARAMPSRTCFSWAGSCVMGPTIVLLRGRARLAGHEVGSG